MTKLHLDTDLGGDIDDLCALAMVLNWPDVELLAVTTNSDDQGRRAGYTRYALRLAGRDDIAVAAGSDYVFQHASPTLVPLSVTVETALRRAYLPALRASGPLVQLIARQAEAFAKESNYEVEYGQTHAGLPDDTINFQHDSLACAIALGWNEDVEISEIRLTFEIKDGWLHQTVDERGKPTRVVTHIDGETFNEHWLRTVVGKAR
jgi:inosine-uridine nucleoside N-ribohydrolase